MSGDAVTPPWGTDSEYGPLLDVLLCPPDNFRWKATSVISKGTLESGRQFEPETALVVSHPARITVLPSGTVRVVLKEVAA